MKVMIIDQKGWSKSVKVEKTITRVGTASGNDIQLHSAKIAPVHLQFILSPDLPSSCKLVNLAGEVVIRTGSNEQQFPSFGTIDVRDGDEVELGEFRLVIKIPLAAEYVQTTSVVEAVLSFPNAVLRPGYATRGLLTIKNNGSQTDCQFKVALSGLPTDCYHIDPIPLLYPDAQEDVLVQLFSRGHYPKAGLHDVFFTITSPANYPGEEMIIKQGVYVVPVFDQTLEIVDDMPKQDNDGGSSQPPEVDLPVEEIEQVEVSESKSPRPLPVSKTGAKKETLPEATPVPKTRIAEAPPKEESQISEQVQEKAQPEIKVMRNQFDDFWEE
ncbi:MAG: FHA domain-containing protein [Chloroflexota bacterium]|nr:FHA domain-containing protein [Chloroflexota bacterium]